MCIRDRPEEVSDILWKRTDYTWPCTWFVPRTNDSPAFRTAYDVMNNWGANHGAISYGHIGADLITLCSMLRIPVSMHNVAEENIFRPAAWNAFGMDKEGQDYQMCIRDRFVEQCTDAYIRGIFAGVFSGGDEWRSFFSITRTK